MIEIIPEVYRLCNDCRTSSVYMDEQENRGKKILCISCERRKRGEVILR